MLRKTGRDLERAGREMFEQLGLRCVGDLAQAPLLGLAPRGQFAVGEHLEFDYLIPTGETCLVGEITSRKDPANVKEKYARFCRHLNVLRTAAINAQLWAMLGVPAGRIREFREVTEFRGFFATSTLESFDVTLEAVPDVVRLYRADLRLLVAYRDALGQYGKHVFLQMFGLVAPPAPHALRIRKSDGLIRLAGCQIAHGTGTATLYTFPSSPYDLLPIARVYRRDLLPDLSTNTEERDYQRPLDPDKLEAIRENLLQNSDFVFPSSILVVLSDDCTWERNTLMIPGDRDSVAVIDGQHRLFSYADAATEARVKDDARMLVTAVQFDAQGPETQRDAARMFVEINSNQTRVQPTHLDAIAFPILGDTRPRALAAQVLLHANGRKNSKVYGIFDTSQTSLGLIPTSTVLSALRPIVNLEAIERLAAPRTRASRERAEGYQNLFDVDTIEEITDAEALIAKAEIALVHFFGDVARAFPKDWPVRGRSRHSTMYLAKGMAGLVRLFHEFIRTGADWAGVRTSLAKLRRNIEALRTDADGILLDYNDLVIPSPQDPVGIHAQFLLKNVDARTSAETLRRAEARRRA